MNVSSKWICRRLAVQLTRRTLNEDLMSVSTARGCVEAIR